MTYQWIILLEAFEKGGKWIDPNDLMIVHYEDLCENSVSVMKSAAKFCELEWSSRFEKALESFELRTANYKWRSDLTPDQQQILQEVLGDKLKEYGYS